MYLRSQSKFNAGSSRTLSTIDIRNHFSRITVCYTSSLSNAIWTTRNPHSSLTAQHSSHHQPSQQWCKPRWFISFHMVHYLNYSPVVHRRNQHHSPGVVTRYIHKSEKHTANNNRLSLYSHLSICTWSTQQFGSVGFYPTPRIRDKVVHPVCRSVLKLHHCM